MKICFLDNTLIPYTSHDLNSNILRGAETVLINLSESFSKLGHQVIVYNNCNINQIINNVSWFNIKSSMDKPYFDLAISNNDIRLFDKIYAKKKILISHSLQSIEKFIRKGQLFSYLRHKPKIALLGKYHKKNRNFFLRIFGNIILDYGISDIFLNSEISQKNLSNKAIFTSRPDRNMALLLDIWKTYIYPKNKLAQLYITPAQNIKLESNIFFRNFTDTKNYINDLINSKVCLIPGHKAELYCLVAEEARELCVPIVTLGIGSLSERVIHSHTGFIAKNYYEFAQYTLDLFYNDVLLNDIRNNLKKLRGSKTWISAAKNFIMNI